MTDVKFTPPTPQDKGYARRMERMGKFMDVFTALQNAKTEMEKISGAARFMGAMPEIVRLLTPYVTVTPGPGDPPMTAEDYLFDEATEDQFMTFFLAVMGGGQGDKVPPVMSAPSDAT